MILVFFFNDTATTEIYTLSLHDALPISPDAKPGRGTGRELVARRAAHPLRPRADATRTARKCLGHGRRRNRQADVDPDGDRKSTRLNSSHANISYAVFCLKKKKNKTIRYPFPILLQQILLYAFVKTLSYRIHIQHLLLDCYH